MKTALVGGVLACACRPAPAPDEPTPPTPSSQAQLRAHAQLYRPAVPQLPASGRASAPLFASQRLPVVEVELGGPRPYRMLVDTGAPYTTITTAVQRELALAEVSAGARALIAGGLGDWKSQPIVKVPRAQLGEIVFLDGVAAVGEPGEAVARDPCHAEPRLDGTIGWSWIAGSVVEFDRAAGRITFARERAAEPVAPLATLSLQTGRPLVPIAIDGQRELALFDTGADFELVLSPKRLQQLGRTLDDPAIVHRLGEALQSGGVAPRSATTEVLLRVGALEFPATHATIVDTVYPTLLLLGMGVLGRHRVVVDAPRGQVLLHGPVADREPFGSFGMTWRADDEGARVRTVWQDSPPHRAGVRVDDVVLAVDGITLAGLPLARRCELLLHWGDAPRTTIRVHTGAGERELTLERRELARLRDE